MTHHELVELATDLLYAAPAAERWLPEYDRALTSPADQELINFVSRLRIELHLAPHRLAA